MLEITKTQDNGTLQKLNLNEAVSGSWFNLINPTREEIQQVSLVLGLDESFLNNSHKFDKSFMNSSWGSPKKYLPFFSLKIPHKKVSSNCASGY